MLPPPPRSTLFPYTTLFRSKQLRRGSRPLVESLEKLAPEDVALREIIEGRISYDRSEEHTSELQSLRHLVCRVLVEKKKKKNKQNDEDKRTHSERQLRSRLR